MHTRIWGTRGVNRGEVSREIVVARDRCTGQSLHLQQVAQGISCSARANFSDNFEIAGKCTKWQRSDKRKRNGKMLRKFP